MNSTTYLPTWALSVSKDTQHHFFTFFPTSRYLTLILISNSRLFLLSVTIWYQFCLVFFIFEFSDFILMYVFLKFVYYFILIGTLTDLVCLGNLWLFIAQISQIAVLLLGEFIDPWEVNGVDSGFGTVKQQSFKCFFVVHLKLLLPLDLSWFLLE